MFNDSPEKNHDYDNEFDDIIGANGPEAKAAADARELKRKQEVNELLAGTGLKPYEISQAEPVNDNDPMAILQEANGGSPRIETTVKAPVVTAVLDSFYDNTPRAPTPSFDQGLSGVVPEVLNDPGDDWADKLGEEYRAARDSAEQLSPDDFPEYPAEFVRSLVKESNRLTKREVFSIIGEFQMSVDLGDVAAKADAIVVTDRSQKALMKEARELRLTLKRERIRIEQVRQEVKEPYLRRTQIIDGIGRTIRDLFETKEKHLKQQEDFEKIENAKIVTANQAVRLGQLAAFGYVPTIEEIQGEAFGSMSDAEWSVFVGNVDKAYNIRLETERLEAEQKRLEDERLTRENAKLQRNQDRFKQVFSIGFIPREGKLQFFALPAMTDIAETAITESTDEDFAGIVRYLTGKAEEFQVVKVEREQARIKAATDAEVERQEKARVDREAAEKAAAERVAAMKPDKEKIDTYMTAIYDVTVKQPKVNDERIQMLLNAYFSNVANLTNALQKDVDGLN